MTELAYHRIAHLFYNRPLALSPAAAETISAYLFSRIGAGPRGARGEDDSGKSSQVFAPTQSADGAIEIHAPRASRFYGATPLDEAGRPLPYRRTEAGVAIITVIGELVNRGAWIGASSGLVSYEGLKFQLARAAQDAQTQAVLLDIESPGGEAVGAFEVAAAVRALAKTKDVVAVVNGMAASAAYAIASGARRIVTMPTGLSGSIGVVMMHLDFSQYLENEGVKPTLIFAGGHKVDGNPFEPLPEQTRARFQQEIESFYAQFVETVAAGRPALSAERVRGTQALIFKGADAVASGLADSVGTFEDVLAELSRGFVGRAPLSTSLKGSAMDKPVGAPAAENAGPQANETKPAASASAAELAAAYPEAASALRAEGANAERARLLGIERVAAGRHSDLVTKLTPEQAALAILEADNAARAAQLAAIKGVEQETGQVPAARPQDAPAQAQTAEDWKAEWAKSDELKREFASAEAYASYQDGVASGRIRRLSAKRA